MYKMYEKMLQYWTILFLIWNLHSSTCDVDMRNRKRYYVDIKDLPLTRQTYNISKSAYNTIRAHKQNANAMIARNKVYQPGNSNIKQIPHTYNGAQNNNLANQKVYTKLVSVTFPLNTKVVYQNTRTNGNQFKNNYNYPDKKLMYKNMYQAPKTQNPNIGNVNNRNMYTTNKIAKPNQNQNKIQDLKTLEKWIIQSTPLISFNKTIEKPKQEIIKQQFPKKFYSTLGQHTNKMQTYYKMADQRYIQPTIKKIIPPQKPLYNPEYCNYNTTQNQPKFNNLKPPQNYLYRATPRLNIFNYNRPTKQFYSGFPVEVKDNYSPPKVNNNNINNIINKTSNQEQSASRAELATFFNSFSMLDNVSKSKSSEKEDSSAEEEDLKAESGCFGPCNDNVDDRVEELKNIMKILVPSNEEMFD